jgi:diguanylate cyclase (GGDEF)-like protein
MKSSFVSAAAHAVQPASGDATGEAVAVPSSGLAWFQAFETMLDNPALEDVLETVIAATSGTLDVSAQVFLVVKDVSAAAGWCFNAGAKASPCLPLITPGGQESLLLDEATASGQPRIVMDLRTVLRNESVVRTAALGFRSAICAPIVEKGGSAVVGAVAVYFAQPPADSDASCDAIAAIARMASSVLQMRAASADADRAENQLAALASTIPGVVYQRRVHPDGTIRYTYISDSAFDLFGVTAKTILSDPEALFQHYGPDYRKEFRNRLLKASAEMSLWDVEATINRPDGTTRYTHAIARPAKEADGSVLWTGVILDATRIKEAELAASLAETNTRIAIVESLSQGLLMFDRDDCLTIRNSHFIKLYPALSDIAVPGATYLDILNGELDVAINPQAVGDSHKDELVDRVVRHGEQHLVYERQLADDRYILVNEYRTPSHETVVLYTDISELKSREKKIQHLAHHDSLTGMPNRVVFHDKLNEAILDAQQTQTTVAVLCLDLDRFKNINDTLGHHIGDLLLQEVARRLQSVLRASDTACRLGGDEFAIIMPGIKSQDVPTSLAWRLLDAVSQPFFVQGQSIVSGTSVGIALSTNGEVPPEDVLKNGDLALYRAKSDGRGTFRYFEAEMDAKAQARRLLEIELRAALALGQLEVHYQPLVDVYTAQMMGVEALVRWNHPTRGYIPPPDFIPLAEETGLISSLGQFVLKQACFDAATWSSDIRVAVNISPAQFKDKHFVAFVKDTVIGSGLDPRRLELEITESMLLRNTDTNLAILHELKALGIRISMDDFGTGYSSLGNLRSFPFDKLKIDKSFITDLNKTADAAAIIRAVLTLGRSLGMTTTAEGVETRDQLTYLRAEGCTEVQGHYYAKALTLDEINEFLVAAPNRVMSPVLF